MAHYLPLILVLLAAGLLVAALTVYLMARGLVRPPRMTDGKAVYLLGRLSPKDLDLPYETRHFDVRDEQTGNPLRLAAWWIPAAERSDRTVVIVHGYADAKVGALAWAPVWRGLGFNALLVDLRAHGESGGTLCSAGFWERHDLAQVVNQLSAAEPAAAGEVVLFGASLGAAVVAATAELTAESGVVRAAVLDSPFADFRAAGRAHFDRLGLPGGFVADSALRLAGWMAQADFAAVRPADVVRRAGVPVLVLAAGEDVYVTPDESAAIESAANDRPASAGPGAFVRFDGVPHLMAVVEEPAAYRAAIEAFLKMAAAWRNPVAQASSL